MTWPAFIRILWLTGLSLMLVSLPFLRLGMSIAGFWLAGVWIFDYVYDCVYRKNPGQKWRQFWSNKAAVLLTGIFGLHLLGLLWTVDFQYGIHDLRIKLPLLFMPLVFTGMPSIKSNELKRLLWLFVVALIASSSWCTWIYFTSAQELYDIREISVFISHIRFSLMIVLAIGVLIYLANHSVGLSRVFALVIMMGFVMFLWLLQSLTGFATLMVVILSWVIFSVSKEKNRTWRFVKIAFPLVLFALIFGYLYVKSADYFTPREDELQNFSEVTESGNKYTHKPDNTLLENGYYVWRNVSMVELEQEWNERSSIDFDQKDKRGQSIYATLIRYLTSKGLKKDSAGVHALNQTDISNIERGIANYKDPGKSGLNKRIGKILFEINAYQNGADPSGNSVTQRLEFWRAGWHIFKEHPVLGVGTGDVPRAFEKAYVEIDSPLNDRWRLRAHNQYLTIAVAFGAIGLIVFLYCFFYPLSQKRHRRDYLYVTFFLISAVSFLNEDTLETQAGITFFTFFSCFFLFVYDSDEVNTSL